MYVDGLEQGTILTAQRAALEMQSNRSAAASRLYLPCSRFGQNLSLSHVLTPLEPVLSMLIPGRAERSLQVVDGSAAQPAVHMTVHGFCG